MPQTDRHRPRRLPRHAWPCLAAAVFVLAMVATRYDATTGLTRLLRFGDRLDERRLPELKNLPLHVYPGSGYDGQYYAQLAVDPDVRHPDVTHAMDYARYRPRRILLPAVVHVLTGGGARPWITINAYALANLVVWLGFGWLLWRVVEPFGWRGSAVWLACMLGVGALDSVRMALTDLPATMLIFLAVSAAQSGRRWPAVGAMAAAVLTRDTALLAAGVASGGDLRSARTWGRHALNGLIMVLPVVAWTAWITLVVPAGTTTGFGHFAWPFVGLIHQLAICGRELLSGNLDSRYLFGFIAVFSLGWQALFVLREINWTALAANPWLRVALPFALFYFVIGDAVWHGYWAVARTCLPLTFAFNLLLLPRGRGFWLHLIAGNLCLLHGVYRMLPG